MADRYDEYGRGSQSRRGEGREYWENERGDYGRESSEYRNRERTNWLDERDRFSGRGEGGREYSEPYYGGPRSEYGTPRGEYSGSRGDWGHRGEPGGRGDWEPRGDWGHRGERGWDQRERGEYGNQRAWGNQW